MRLVGRPTDLNEYSVVLSGIAAYALQCLLVSKQKLFYATFYENRMIVKLEQEKGLLQEQVTQLVTRPDRPVWS